MILFDDIYYQESIWSRLEPVPFKQRDYTPTEIEHIFDRMNKYLREDYISKFGFKEDIKMIKQSNENCIVLSFLNKFMAGHNGFICGGCFKNIFSKEKIRDIDIFFENQSDYNEAVLKFNGDTEFTHCYSSKNVEAYKHKDTSIVIELCHTIYGTPECIISQFDFTIVKFAYFKETIQDGTETRTEYKVLYHENFFEHLLMKRLVIDNTIPFPINTFERTLKYIRYGFLPCYETKLKLLEAINKLSEEQIKTKETFYDGYD